jgi:hypothetical protein
MLEQNAMLVEPSIFLAEISDKMPSITLLVAVHLLLTAAAGALIRVTRRLAILLIPACAWWVYAAVNDLLLDAHLRADVIGELGYRYLVLSVVLATLPLVAVVAGLAYHSKKWISAAMPARAPIS